MNKLLQNGNKQRGISTGIGLVAANFIVAILVDQFGVPLHANVVATGSLLLAAVINKLVGKFWK